MTKYLKIAILILVIFVIYAPSCVDEDARAMRDDDILTEARNDVRVEFETDYLSEVSLFAYESTAKQKLSDFIDYLHILADTSLNMSFRLKAGEMIQSTFLSKNVNVQLCQPGDKQPKKLDIQKLVEKGLKNELSFRDFSIGTIHVMLPLQRAGDVVYKGSLSFSKNFIIPDPSGQKSNSISNNADIFLIKEDKIFGTDTLRVWSVKLGEILVTPVNEVTP